jgi:CRISPR-associated protein Cas5d
MSKTRYQNDVVVDVWGDAALFTRPEMKAERVTYEIMTPSAAVGLLSSIYWHPGVRYGITRIEILAPIQLTYIRRNETTLVGNATRALRGVPLDVSRERTQRMTVYLTNPRYRISAQITLGPEARHGFDATRDQLMRRVTRGAFYTQPYLGVREFGAFFSPPDSTYEPIAEDKMIGMMPLRAIYEGDQVVDWEWFSARVTRGVMEVPAYGQRGLSAASSGVEAAG